MGSRVETMAKTVLVEVALGTPPVLLDRCSLILPSFPLESIPVEPLTNLKFAIRTILASSGKAVDEKEVKRLARETTSNFLTSVKEIFDILNAKPGVEPPWPKFVKPEIPDEVRAFLSQKGIIASFHSGNVLTAANFFREVVTGDVAVFMERQPPALQKRLISFAETFGIVPVFVDDMIKEPTKMFRKIRGIPYLVTLFDRPPKKNSAVEVDFFGKPALFLEEPARLAQSWERPILPVAVVKLGDGAYTAEFGKIVRPKEYHKENKQEAVRATTQAVISELEPIIRKYPTSFYSFYERFWVGQD